MDKNKLYSTLSRMFIGFLILAVFFGVILGFTYLLLLLLHISFTYFAIAFIVGLSSITVITVTLICNFNSWFCEMTMKGE